MVGEDPAYVGVIVADQDFAAAEDLLAPERVLLLLAPADR